MKTKLFYFTGTGNSLAITKSLSNNLGNCEIKSIVKSIKNNEFNLDSECMGLIFPNHFGKVPKIVKEFISKSDFINVKYCFAVISGGAGSGYAFNQLSRLLKQKGIELNAACEIILPSNQITAPYYVNGNRDDQTKKVLFKEADNKILMFADVIKDRKNHFDVSNDAKKIIMMLINLTSNLTNIEKLDRYYLADNKCNSCGICKKICPVSNIDISNGKPKWAHKCQMCMACIQFCPREAIQYKKDTQNKKRYHHPSVTLEEIISQS